jgi:hypothetical protein
VENMGDLFGVGGASVAPRERGCVPDRRRVSEGSLSLCVAVLMYLGGPDGDVRRGFGVRGSRRP